MIGKTNESINRGDQKGIPMISKTISMRYIQRLQSLSTVTSQMSGRKIIVQSESVAMGRKNGGTIRVLRKKELPAGLAIVRRKQTIGRTMMRQTKTIAITGWTMEAQ